MTDAVRDTIRATVEPFVDADVVADVLTAAAAVPQGDDPHLYAVSIAGAVVGVLEAALARRWDDLRRIRRETAIAEAVGRAMRQSVGPQRH